MSRQLPVRRTGAHARRPRGPRRASRPLAIAQLLAIVAMVGCVGAVWAAGAAPAFGLRTLQLSGARFTSEAAVRAIVGMTGRSPNAFGVQTDRLAEELVRLPAVESARVEVRLPGTLAVSLVERAPRLIWAVGGGRYAVDATGLLFGLVDSAGRPVASAAGPLTAPSATASPSAGPSPTEGPSASTPEPTASPAARPSPAGSASPGSSASAAPTPSPLPRPSLAAPPAPAGSPGAGSPGAATATPGSLGLPVVFDRRAADAGLRLGDSVDAVSLDAGFRIARLTPAQLDSTSPSLATVLDDAHGFTLSSVPPGWVAEFGIYTPNLRKVDVIPTQVRDLRALFAEYGESRIYWVWLMAGIPGQVNTYLPR